MDKELELKKLAEELVEEEKKEAALLRLVLDRVTPQDLPRPVIVVSTPGSTESWVEFHLRRFNKTL